MGQYIVTACFTLMVIGGAIAVVGRAMRRIEGGGDTREKNRRRELILMFVGAALFVPTAVLLVIMVKYF